MGTTSLLLDGGTIRTADGSRSEAALALPVPGRAGSLSYNRDIVIDTVRPLLTGASVDLGTGTLSLAFDSDMGAQVAAEGIALKDAQGLNPTVLAGAQASVDGSRVLVSMTEAQRAGIVRDRERLADTLADPGILMDVSGSAVRDSLGNFFAGTTSYSLDITPDAIRPERAPGPPVADFVSGTLSVGFNEAIDAASIDLSGIALFSADRSASVVLAGATAVHSGGAVLITFTGEHNRRLYETGIASRGSALLDISATAVPDLSGNFFAGAAGEQVLGRYYLQVQDGPAASDSASSYASAASSSDAPSVSDGALALRGLVASARDFPAFSDSGRAYKSGHIPADTAAFSDSASSASMVVSLSADTAAFSDSARAYRSGAAVSDSPAFSDSASRAGMKITASSDTAAFSDSARAYLSSATLSDSPAFSDSASRSGMRVSASSDTAAFSDSAARTCPLPPSRTRPPSPTLRPAPA